MNFDPETDNEGVLDEEIVPLIRQLGDLCMARGMPLLVGVQFSKIGICRTLMLPSDAHPLLIAGGAAMAPDAFSIVDIAVEGEKN